jgi:dipeptidyl aminopeptidase/acylaminoacyl peptidase
METIMDRYAIPATIALGLWLSFAAADEASGVDRDSAVGWYGLASGDEVLVTYAATGPLRLYQLGAHYRAEALTETARGEYLAETADGPAALSFHDAGARPGPGFDLRGPDGRLQRATRLAEQPYRLREVEYASDVTLSATVLLPDRPSPVAGAVLVHGSGDSDRDNGWYLTIADHLARAGIAVLFPDKRGTGRSGGDWQTARFADFAADALAGRDRLAAIPGVDPARVGLIGMSQGGSWVVPAAITLTDDLPWVVNVVGTTVTPNEQLRHETRQTLRQKGVPGWLVPVIEPVAVWVPKRRRSQWWDLNGDYDPMPAWAASDIPVLVVYGGEDETDNVPVGESLARLAPLMRPPSRFRVEVFEDSGHGLYTPGTRTIRPEFLALLAEWIAARAPGPV